MKTKDSSDNLTDVLLITMPFNILRVPSVALSLLKPAVASLGISTKILYFNLKFAKLIGEENYIKIRNQFLRFKDGWSISEWIFSHALFSRSEVDKDEYIKYILHHSSQHGRQSTAKPDTNNLIKIVLDVCDKVNGFLDECFSEVADFHPRIVGFNSIIQQHTASLALAQRIKARCPQTFIVFGGPNCQGVMGKETICQFSFVDAVVSGEGDIVFPQLVQKVLSDEHPPNIPGIFTKPDSSPNYGGQKYPNVLSVQNMDTLPFPDCDDYFDQLKSRSLQLPYDPLIAIETSRGCWWGEKTHCTFCSSYGSDITYRRKSGFRVCEELIHLVKKYQISGVDIFDNIMNIDVFKTILTHFASKHLGTRLGVGLSLQVKSDLKKNEIEMLAKAGIKVIQPGIESLSTIILKQIGKGVSALQNVQILKWCKEFGIFPHWNILWGFPQESRGEYSRMAQLIPLLVHLQPPLGTGCFTLLRFSPQFDDAEKLGLKDVVPAQSYKYIYPFVPDVLKNLSYYFTFNYQSSQDVDEYTRPVTEACETWKEIHDSCDLFYLEKNEKIFIWDQRPIASQSLTILSGFQKTLYTACDTIRSLTQLKKLLKNQNDKTCTDMEVERFLEPILRQKLMIKEGKRYLSLAVSVGSFRPRKEVFDLFLRDLNSIEIKEKNEAILKKVKINDVPNFIKIDKDEIRKSMA